MIQTAFIWILFPLVGIAAIFIILVITLFVKRGQTAKSHPSPQKSESPSPVTRRHSPELVSEAKAKMEDFIGCFEPLHRASTKGSADSCRLIMQEVANRIRHFNGCDHLKAWIASLMQDSAQWDESTSRSNVSAVMQLFAQAGLEYDHRDSVTVDADTSSSYYHDELDMLPEGETFPVKSPCWTLGGKVLEKGILK